MWKRKPIIVAHRGVSQEAPENTIPAFYLAWQQGADAIEGDFRQTKDGHIVCIHDEDTLRMAGKKVIVRESLLKDLQEVDIGKHAAPQYRGTGIPTLADVLATIPAQKKIYIEVKTDESILTALVQDIQASQLQDEQIVVISFSKEVIRLLKHMAPQYKALWLAIIKKDNAGKISPSVQTVLTILDDIGADGFSSSRHMDDESFVRSIIDHGYEYHVWTVDDLQAARKFMGWGTLSITTNTPAAIKKYLGEN